MYTHSQEDALRDAAASFRQDVTNGDAESGSPGLGTHQAAASSRRNTRAPSRTRTDTGRILSPLPLPIGLWGPGGESSAPKPDPRHPLPPEFGLFLSVRCRHVSRRIRAPHAFSLRRRPNPDDTAVSPGKNLLKL